MEPQQPPKPAPVAPPKSSLRHNPPPPVQQLQRSRSSQMLRPMSMKPTTAKHPSGWDPPPLFQAYPQSIKHATVQSCAFSPDVLLRTQSQRKQYDMLRERMDSHRDLPSTLDNSAETRKLEKTHKRLMSNSTFHSASPQLANKIYVLVTSGYVLQYSGDGAFDRLPEKVLKLGKESAAFACDLIPGKHWVLQISQSANEDGTVAIGPKSSLLSRLRLQSASTRKTATSFLLVLESAEEMDSWMTTVRKEIDNLGGMKSREDTIRESSSTDESSSEKQSQDSSGSSQRYTGQRNHTRITRALPVDSPMQGQYDSPKIVASDWEGDRSERTVSIVDSASIHSRYSTKRKSIEASSIATTVISHDQVQLDQLRERSRFSYMSNATSVSGTGTRNTSRNSSPAPNSPLKEGFAPADAEPLRSATSLRSFHMSPNNANATRRRSMQPLPVTNEDASPSARSTSVTSQRHSIYGPTSPTLKQPEPKLDVPTSAAPAPQLAPLLCNPTNNARYSTQHPVRQSVRSSSAPPARYGAISPPPQEPAPPPGRPQSTIGALPMSTMHSSRRLSQTPKPFLRPLPVRPQAQHVDGSVVVPRRFSSLSPAPAPIPLGIVVNRSVTAPVRPPPAQSTSSPHLDTAKTAASSQPLRRPTSVQIRSDPAPFLSSSRPTRAVSNTPSFVPGKRLSTIPSLYQSPSIPALRQQAAQRGVAPRRSMPVIGLPPPAPPPNMPLPPPPPVAAPRAVAV
ncbi:hypothetical protein K491DRAFT_607412 [Lophiostoma macrostomum CBS 122681]|uniref:PH domain-containing protein n=1 Tax=Lophiostoma macrostomum CBS 122681 TaxID=1314788 RepID=A0A6A6SUB8_9PLEO|nr:hypothetical protein K491DRAFT_607412 [Lophiostoma macrostomum CBS 122681]